jgi:class 3 adenylate cyclase
VGVSTRDEPIQPGAPLAFVAVNPGAPDERIMPIHDLLVIGRECAGVEKSHQLIIEDESVSRRHAEIRLDAAADRAYVFDTSTNGTRVNGGRVEHATEVALRPGDRLTVGDAQLEFRSDRFHGQAEVDVDDGRSTVRAVNLGKLALVAGDVIGYEAISQYTDEDTLLKSIDQLFGELSSSLTRHRGALNQSAGESLFATWEVSHDPDAAEHALSFAIEANDLVTQVAPSLDLRTPDDEPIRMGWGVAIGPAAVSAVAGGQLAVLGDAANVAWKLSEVAGREARANVVVSSPIEEALRGQFEFSEAEELMVKGRLGSVKVFGALGRR